MDHRSPHLRALALGAHFHHLQGHILQAGQRAARGSHTGQFSCFGPRSCFIASVSDIPNGVWPLNRAVGRAYIREIVPALDLNFLTWAAAPAAPATPARRNALRAKKPKPLWRLVCPESGVTSPYLPHPIANTPVGHWWAMAATAGRPAPPPRSKISGPSGASNRD
jgi:hypothetical protein